jgi:hypothetical protein
MKNKTRMDSVVPEGYAVLSAEFTIVLRCASAQGPVGQGSHFFTMDFCLCGAIFNYCSYLDFLDRELLLTRKLLTNHDLVNPYRIYVSQMIKDMFCLSKSQSGPIIIHDLSPIT